MKVLEVHQCDDSELHEDECETYFLYNVCDSVDSVHNFYSLMLFIKCILNFMKPIVKRFVKLLGGRFCFTFAKVLSFFIHSG